MSIQYQITGSGSNEIADSVELGVSRGRLEPGARLPTVRALARRLGVSFGTVASAYRALQARGVIASDGRRGTIVRPAPPLVRGVAAVAVPAGIHNLTDGNPDPELLPPFARALRNVARRPVLYGSEPYDARLLALAQRSFKADGIDSSAIAILHGALDGIERALSANLRPGDRVAVEDPVYPAHLDLLAALGLVAEPVAIDAGGMRPDALIRAARHGARAAILSPRAQNPTGAAFGRPRQEALSAVLDRYPGIFLIEDDHAWLVAGAPYRTLTRARERWFVVRSFSKAFGPDLRVAVAAGDPMTIGRLKGRQQLGVGWVSHISQSIARTMWIDPAVIERIETAGETYAARREALVAGLAVEGIEIETPSGLNCWLPVRNEASTVAALRNAGYAVAAGERFRIAAPPAIRVTIARLGLREAPALARAIAATQRAGAITRSA